MTGRVRLEQGSAPPTPASGYTSVFVDSVDRHVKQIDEFGAIIDLTKGEGLVANRTVIINAKTDLPAPSGGVITLVGNTNYVLGDDITMGTDRFDASAGNISWTSNNVFGPTLTYEGNGILFTIRDASFNIFATRIDCPNGGTVFDMEDITSPNSSIFVMEQVVVANCGKLGRFGTIAGLAINNSRTDNASDGWEFQGSGWSVTSVTKYAIVSASPTLIGIDFQTMISGNIEFDNLVFAAPSGAVALRGVTGGGNLLSDSFGVLLNSNFLGALTAISGFDPSNDIRWSAFGNNTVPDSKPGGLIFMRGNTTATVIADTATPVLLAGTWSTRRESKFTTTSAGRATYIGEKSLFRPLFAQVVLEPVSGNSRDITAYFARNGVVDTDSGVTLNINANDPKIIPLEWTDTLDNGDYLEIYLQNSTAIVNVLASDVTFTF